MASLCLNMIVKNESHVIEATLENICRYFPIDYWVVSDTGSTDNTIELIENFFKNKNISGEIHHEPWQNFEYNRNQALDACQHKADYVVFFDADDFIEGRFQLPELTGDLYIFHFSDEQRNVRYQRPLIIKNNQKYRWKGVLHEMLVTDQTTSKMRLDDDYLVISGRTGSRNLDPEKDLKDALLLEQAYSQEQDPIFAARYAFYCAQSYGVYSSKVPEYLDKAIKWYHIRIELNPPYVIDSDKYIAYENLGRLYERKKNAAQTVLAWQRGISLAPQRAECMYLLAIYYYQRQQTQLAYTYLKAGYSLPVPINVVGFLNKNVYQINLPFSFCAVAAQVGAIEDSYAAFKKVLPKLALNDFMKLEGIIPKYQTLLLNDSLEQIEYLKKHLLKLGRWEIVQSLLNQQVLMQA